QSPRIQVFWPLSSLTSGRCRRKGSVGDKSNVQGPESNVICFLTTHKRSTHMAKVKKFEEIQSWKRARSLTKEIYRATLTGSFAKDFGLKDQMRRSAVSMLSNIAEGFERG